MGTSQMSDRELMERIYSEVKETRKITKGLLARARMQNALGIIKWIIYIGILFGIYHYVQPYLEQLIATYAALQDSADVINNLQIDTSSLDLNSVLNLLQ